MPPSPLPLTPRPPRCRPAPAGRSQVLVSIRCCFLSALRASPRAPPSGRSPPVCVARGPLHGVASTLHSEPQVRLRASPTGARRSECPRDTYTGQFSRPHPEEGESLRPPRLQRRPPRGAARLHLRAARCPPCRRSDAPSAHSTRLLPRRPASCDTQGLAGPPRSPRAPPPGPPVENLPLLLGWGFCFSPRACTPFYW